MYNSKRDENFPNNSHIQQQKSPIELPHYPYGEWLTFVEATPFNFNWISHTE